MYACRCKITPPLDASTERSGVSSCINKRNILRDQTEIITFATSGNVNMQHDGFSIGDLYKAMESS